MKCPTCGGWPNDRRMLQGAPPPIQRVGPGGAEVKYSAPYAACADLFHGMAEPAGVGPARTNNPAGNDLWRSTMKWIDEHPIAARLFLRYAEDLMAARKARNSKKGFSAKYIMERVRWEADVTGQNESDYVLNNNMTAYLGRWLIQQNGDLKKYLKLRKVRYQAPKGNEHIDPPAEFDPITHWQE